VHVVVGVSLDSEKEVRGCSVPAMLLINRFVYSTGVLLAQQAVVLSVVDKLDEEDADASVDKLEN